MSYEGFEGMRLEKGMYVRLYDGVIERVESWVPYDNNILTGRMNCRGIMPSEIIKASHNIIDIIEVGDYVNGWEVTAKKDRWLFVPYKIIENHEIRTILTKEQYKSQVYRVE